MAQTKNRINSLHELCNTIYKIIINLGRIEVAQNQSNPIKYS